MLKNFKIKQKINDSKAKQKFQGLKINNILSFKLFRSKKKEPEQAPIIIPRTPADYIKKFTQTAPVEFISDTIEQQELVISTAYKQVFGNVHLMESERLLEAESQLRSGQITVIEFIRQLAKSERYRALVFEKNSNLRAVELNFKHLLGRAPESYAEVSEHIARLANEGFDAEIDSYLNSDEYFQTFGADIVPYYRGYQTQVGRNLVGYTHSFELAQGGAISDLSTPESSYMKLDESLLSCNAITALLANIDISEKVKQLAKAPRKPYSSVSKYGPRSASPSSNIYAPKEIIRRTLNLHYPDQTIQTEDSTTCGTSEPYPNDPAAIARKALNLPDPEPTIQGKSIYYYVPPTTYPNDPAEIARKALIIDKNGLGDSIQ